MYLLLCATVHVKVKPGMYIIVISLTKAICSVSFYDLLDKSCSPNLVSIINLGNYQVCFIICVFDSS
jgi:hypothetical protein